MTESGMRFRRVDKKDGITEFFFENQNEARAFVLGVHFVDDSSIEVKSVTRTPRRGLWRVTIRNEDA